MHECTLFDNFHGKTVTTVHADMKRTIALAYRYLLESQMDPNEAAAINVDDHLKLTSPGDDILQCLTSIDSRQGCFFIVVETEPEIGPLGFVRKIS